jgi:hypothetical protein
MAEFKKLSEVEQIATASDNATVLVEEGGEIKRVPKKEVGGAGGYVIKLDHASLDDDGVYRIEDNYDELYDILIAGGSAWIDYEGAPSPAPCALSTNIYDYTNISPVKTLVWGWALTDIGLAVGDVLHGEGAAVFFPNGSHNLDPVIEGPV